MRKTKILFLMIFLISFIFVATSCTGGLLLFIDVEKGDTYRIDMNQKTIIDMSMEGETITVDQENEFVYLVDIKDVDEDGNVTAEYKFDSMKISMETPAGNISFDSNTADENEPILKLVGSSYTAKMTKHGEIIEITGLNDMMDSIIDPNDPNTEIFKDSFSEESIKEMMGQSTIIYPDEKIEPGYTWEENISMDSMFSMDINTVYTLNEIEDGTASISMDAEFSADMSEMMEKLGLEAQGKLEGTMTGDTEVNVRNSFISNGTIKMDLSGTIDSSFQGTTFSMPMDITNETTFSTTKQ